MPVTQRWVHGGLLLVAVIFSVSLTVLILGASRPIVNNAGLAGSRAPMFALREKSGQWVQLKDYRDKTVVLLITTAQAPDFERQAHQISGLLDSYGDSSDIHFMAVEFDPGAGMLKESAAINGVVETWLPSLSTMRDIDGSVAQAYRVGQTPMLFVIDGTGFIRARIPLEGNGSTIAASEMLASQHRSSLPLPSMATDRKLY